MKSMINWFTIPAEELSRAVDFYSNVLDMELVQHEGPDGCAMAMFLDPQEKNVNGSIEQRPEMKPGKEGVSIYLNADGQLDSILSRVEEAGGEVVQTKTSIGEWGFVASMQDSEGNLVGLHDSVV